MPEGVKVNDPGRVVQLRTEAAYSAIVMLGTFLLAVASGLTVAWSAITAVGLAFLSLLLGSARRRVEDRLGSLRRSWILVALPVWAVGLGLLVIRYLGDEPRPFLGAALNAAAFSTFVLVITWFASSMATRKSYSREARSTGLRVFAILLFALFVLGIVVGFLAAAFQSG